jgi:hypothetical protein
MPASSIVVAAAIGVLVPIIAGACGSNVQRDDAMVELRCAPFQAPKHRLTMREGTVMRIDGQGYSGTDGSVPEREIVVLKLKVGDMSYAFPRNLYGQLYEPHVPPHSIDTLTLQRTADHVLFTFRGGDGAGSYDVVWVLSIASGVVLRLLYEQPNPERAKIIRAKLKANHTVDPDARKSGARRSP